MYMNCVNLLDLVDVNMLFKKVYLQRVAQLAEITSYETEIISLNHISPILRRHVKKKKEKKKRKV